MKSKTLLLGLFILVIIALNACAPAQTSTTTDFFNGDVLVEYVWTLSSRTEDTLTLTFYEVGKYDFAFAYTPNTNNGDSPLPDNFTVEVTEVPYTKVLSREDLPAWLDIEITHNDLSETHSFE